MIVQDMIMLFWNFSATVPQVQMIEIDLQHEVLLDRLWPKRLLLGRVALVAQRPIVTKLSRARSVCL